MQASFAGGLQEHLQAAGGANAATAASLRESLGTSAQILSDLKTQKSKQLLCLLFCHTSCMEENLYTLQPLEQQSLCAQAQYKTFGIISDAIR